MRGSLANVAPKETLILRSIAKRCVSKDGRAAHPPSFMGTGLPSRSPQCEGWRRRSASSRRSEVASRSDF
jgi:hypothetical protein